MFLRSLGRYKGLVFAGRTFFLAPNLARPRPAALPGAPTRPTRGMSRFGFYRSRTKLIQLVHLGASLRTQAGSPAGQRAARARRGAGRPVARPPAARRLAPGYTDMPCMKRACRDKKASVHWSAAKEKERLSSRGQTADEPVVNRGFCSSIGLPNI